MLSRTWQWRAWRSRAWLSRLHRDTEGVAAVEMALMFPFFVTVVLGAVDTSNLLLETHRVEQGLELGATYLAKAPDPDAVLDQTRNVAVTGQPVGGTSRVRGWVPGDVSISFTNACIADGSGACQSGMFRTGEAARIATVSSTHDYEGFGLISALMRRQLTITATHQERVDK